MKTTDTLVIPPTLHTTIEPRYQQLLDDKIPAAWLWMERNGIPRLDKLGRFPITRRGWMRRAS